MSIERQAVAALKWSTISKIAAQSIAWVVTLIVIRLLSPEDYGLMAISAVIISIAAAVGELGLGASIVRSKTITEIELANVAGALLVLNITLAALIGMAAPLAGTFFGDDRLINVIRASALMLLFYAAGTIPQSLAYRDMSFKWLGVVELVTSMVMSISTLALAWFGAGVWALVLGNLSGALGRAVLLLSRSRSVRPQFGFRDIGSHLKFGGTMTATRMAWQLVYQLDIVIAGRLLAKEAVGIYSVSLHLATLPMQKIMNVLSQVVFPTVARMQADPARLRVLLLQALRLLAFVAVPVLWGISCVAPEFVALVLGEQWLGAAFPLQAVTVVVPIRMLSSVLASSVSGLGRPDIDFFNMLVSAVVLPVAFIVGVRWGIDGLAVSWVVAVPVIFLANLPRTARVLGIRAHEVARAVHGPVAAGIAMYATVAAARYALGLMPDLPRLLALIVVGALTYLGATWLLDRQIWVDMKRLLGALGK